MVLCGVVWYCVALSGILWRCVVLCGVVLYCVALYGFVWRCVVLCGVKWRYVVVVWRRGGEKESFR